MAATDQHYRDQNKLDVVFALSSIAMLVSLILMFVQDRNREYVPEQRVFRDVESALAQRLALERLPEEAEFELAEKNLAQARQDHAQRKDELKDLRGKVAELMPAKEKKEAEFQLIKANLESKVSFYDIEVDHHGPTTERARELKKSIEDLESRLAAAKAERDAVLGKMQALQARADAIDEPLTRAVGKLKKLNDRFDSEAKAAVAKQWRTGDWVRSLPILDAFASPIKIHQYTINDVPIDYNFKYVTRFDRCVTCHQGIAKEEYSRKNLLALRSITDEQDYRLRLAQHRLAARKDALAGLADAAQVPDPAKLKLDILEDDRLTGSRIDEFCAHPRLDLFVGSNSKHPAEKFGCTSCHSGQGSATSFTLASHTPNTSPEERQWKKEFGWESQHYWDFPMHPMRFIESGCLKCHHQVTDLITSDNRNEAPKLVRGFQTINDFGCFGCHEIAGNKAGRPVGPDLRLEPTPPLVDRTPAERERLENDAENPPGTLRKVGPSLKRLAEKTNPEWVARWLTSPRGFRPDTKMPHFYGLSNNHPDVLPPEQKEFPNTEAWAMSHFLFRLSEDFLGEIKYFKNDKNYSPTEFAKDEAYHAFLDRYFASRATMTADRLKKLEELLPPRSELPNVKMPSGKTFFAHYRGILDDLGGALPADDNKNLQPYLEKEMRAAAHRMHLRQDVPLLVDLAPGHQADEKRGRILFSERGCLACHMHDGTARSQGRSRDPEYSPGITSDAQFGPNLSQVVAKLGSKAGDPLSARNWLIQWLVDPTVHSPRTRMPSTFLTAPEAADIAQWLLTREPSDLGDDWDKVQVQRPGLKQLQDLAAVYLVRLLSRAEMDALLKEGKIDPGVKKDLPAEERALADSLASPDLKGKEEGLAFYVGKKAVGRLGCYACHDIQGFENAKPIGVALNDWGKKDPGRLAFEDIDNFLANHFQVVDSLTDENGKPIPPKVVDGKVKVPYERFYADALTHRHREGYLNQKILDPRSYDYNRLRAWDDRSRMPQFRFARLLPKKEEPKEEFAARQVLEEAKAREAVATFVLGLVAEPVPLNSIHQPKGDRLAVVKGRQVLDRFNCGGCHLVQPGVVEFELNDRTRAYLENKSKEFQKRQVQDHDFPGHYFFTGPDPKSTTKATAHAANIAIRFDPEDPAIIQGGQFYLSQALRFRSEDRNLKDIGSYTFFAVAPNPTKPQEGIAIKDMISPPPEAWRSPEALQAYLKNHGPFGGAFSDLLAEYLVKKDKNKTTPFYKPDEARASGPPVLFAQGERTQPEWLYQFLVNPQPVRKMSVLRMPKFNLSEGDARAIVEYFQSLERINNPAIGLTAPYERIRQQDGLDADYWKKKNAEYVARLKTTYVPDGSGKPTKTTWFEKRLQEMDPVWRKMAQDHQDRLKAAAVKVQSLEAAVKPKREDLAKLDAAVKALEGKKGAEAELAKAKNDLKALQDPLAEEERSLAAWKSEHDALQKNAGRYDPKTLREEWQNDQAYVADAYRLLFNQNLCAKCHQLGDQPNPNQLQGPPLHLAHKRLRPGWLERWISNPQYYLTYGSVMPNNFTAGKSLYQEQFVGSSLDQIVASRDVLMLYPQAQALSINRLYVLPPVPAAPASGKQPGEKK